MLEFLAPALFCGILLLIMAPSCAPAGRSASTSAPERDEPRSYAVQRTPEPITVDADWSKPTWASVPVLELTGFMGDRPEHFPRTQAKLLYDSERLYVIFRVDDRYVRAVATGHQGPVCRDSCVEFFFTPGKDVEVGYFNLEMNCGGTMLFHFARVPRQRSTRISSAHLEQIKVAHSLPRIVDPERTEPTVWTVEYALPLALLKDYCPSAQKPEPGVVWRANIYKCGDQTSHPHWLTWSPVDFPKPDFHRPQSFGRLNFE